MHISIIFDVCTIFDTIFWHYAVLDVNWAWFLSLARGGGCIIKERLWRNHSKGGISQLEPKENAKNRRLIWCIFRGCVTKMSNKHAFWEYWEYWTKAFGNIEQKFGLKQNLVQNVKTFLSRNHFSPEVKKSLGKQQNPAVFPKPRGIKSKNTQTTHAPPIREIKNKK